jgi:hypothetical protein
VSQRRLFVNHLFIPGGREVHLRFISLYMYHLSDDTIKIHSAFYRIEGWVVNYELGIIWKKALLTLFWSTTHAFVWMDNRNPPETSDRIAISWARILFPNLQLRSYVSLHRLVVCSRVIPPSESIKQLKDIKETWCECNFTTPSRLLTYFPASYSKRWPREFLWFRQMAS